MWVSGSGANRGEEENKWISSDVGGCKREMHSIHLPLPSIVLPYEDGFIHGQVTMNEV